MNILVTGASGHTGRRLTQQLMTEGHSVLALSRTPDKLAEFADRVTLVRGDLTESPTDLAARITPVPDAIVAMTHIRFAERIIALAGALGTRRVICTSSTRRFTNFPEETARAVIAGEAALEAADIDYTIIRPTMIYGGDKDNNMTHLVNALRKYPIHPLPDGGKMLWQPIYTWDVVHAICGAIARPAATCRRSFTVAGPRAMTYRQIVETILTALGRRDYVWLVPVPIGAVGRLCALWTRLTGKRAPLAPDQIARLRENKNFDPQPAIDALGYTPTEFEQGIRTKLRGDA